MRLPACQCAGDMDPRFVSPAAARMTDRGRFGVYPTGPAKICRPATMQTEGKCQSMLSECVYDDYGFHLPRRFTPHLMTARAQGH